MLALARRPFLAATAARTAPLLPRCASKCRCIKMHITAAPPGFQEVIFIETGTGTDQHGKNVTKACVRAIKDAISWNSIPSLERLVPNGNEGVRIRLQLAVPFDGDTPPPIDLTEIESQFAYGSLTKPIEIMPGGARFQSMCSVPELGDDDAADSSWIVAVACVTVG